MNKYFLPVYHSELKPWIKWWILKRLNGGESSLKAVTISSGTLTKVDKSKALSIKEYYGNTVQNGTPSPESPVEIKTISGDNTFTINGVNYNLDLKSKQLFDKSTVTNGYRLDGSGNASSSASNEFTSDYIEIAPNTTYIRSSEVTAYTRTCFYDNSKTFISKDDSNQIITTPSNARYLRFSEYNSRLDTIMINEGSTALPYESYYNYELCKIGDYKDKIVNDNGTWKVEKKVGKVVLNGTENWVKRSDISTITTSCFRTDYSTEVSANMVNGTILLSNMFTCLNNTNDVEHFRYIGAANYRLQLFINKSRLSSDDSTGLKTWLSTHNTNVYYILATPTTETITNTTLISQLNALYEFYVNSSTVTISNNSEIPLEVLLEYYGR